MVLLLEWLTLLVGEAVWLVVTTPPLVVGVMLLAVGVGVRLMCAADD